jgi:CheY-like chemotaxis protein
MGTVDEPGALAPGILEQLRHDLLNPLNVLVGASSMLLQTELTDAQRAWVKMLQSTTERLLSIVEDLDSYQKPSSAVLEGRARLADLCSIAAARVGKPFDRQQLVRAIESAAGTDALRILLVDDSPELARLVRAYLSSTGWQLDVVDTGEQAVAQAMTEQYDVVLMDIDLPGLDGATAAHAIRAADLARGASPTPIIAMTAFDPGPIGMRSPDTRLAEDPAAALTGRDAAADADVNMDAGVALTDADRAAPVSEYLEHRHADVRALRAWLRAGAFDRIEACAQLMKGTGDRHGFPGISRLGAHLTIAAHRQDPAAIDALVAELAAYLAEVRVV